MKGKDILSTYGPDSHMPMAKRAKGGGRAPERDVMNYRAPSIPGWDPHGSKSPGLGGTIYPSGFQGQKSCPPGDSGGPGLGGRNKGTGVNRKG